LIWVNVKTVSSGSGVPTLDRKEVHKIIVTHPPLEEQRRLADMLHEQMVAVENVRAAAEEELQTINALPAALLRRAFSGEI
jgi:type I restriction enzyme S subunit